MKIRKLLDVLEKYQVIFGDAESDTSNNGNAEGNICDYLTKETDIDALCHDSRCACAGSIFFCLSGTKVDGAKFAGEAVAKGAVCIVAEKRLEVLKGLQVIVPCVREAMSLMSKAFYGNKVDEMRVVGVVGTNGKTTCTHILRHIFSVTGETVGVIGTLGTWFGDELIEKGLTTPDPIELHRTFAEMYDEGIHTVIMEVSAHAIHFNKIAGIVFETVLFTNISHDHLDFFGSFENYCNTKIKFFVKNETAIKTAVINIENEFGKKILDERKGKSVEYFLSEVLLFSDKSIINGEFEVNLPARFNAENALGCLTAARSLGISDEKIKQALKTIPSIPGRFNVFKIQSGTGGEITAVVDFAHTPEGLEKIILAVKEFAEGRVISVFGCGGDRDKKKRPVMGEISARLSDFTVITSDNPRFERPLAIMKQIRKGFRAAKNKNFMMIKNRAQAIEVALVAARAGDVVIIAGKGGETFTDVKGKQIKYTDESVIESVITTHINKGV